MVLLTEIENYRVRSIGLDRAQRGEPVPDLLHVEPGECQRAAEHALQVGVVFHDQDSATARHYVII